MPFISRSKLEALETAKQEAETAKKEAETAKKEAETAKQDFENYQERLSKAFSRIRDEVPEIGLSVTNHQGAMCYWGGYTAPRLSKFIEEWLDEYKQHVAANRAVTVRSPKGKEFTYQPASHWEADYPSSMLTVYLGKRVIAHHAEYASVSFKEGTN